MSKASSHWAHYIILCYNLPGGTTEENVASYKNTSIDDFRKSKKDYEDMEEYLLKFK